MISLFDRQAPLVWRQILDWLRQGVPSEKIPEAWRAALLQASREVP